MSGVVLDIKAKFGNCLYRLKTGQRYYVYLLKGLWSELDNAEIIWKCFLSKTSMSMNFSAGQITGLIYQYKRNLTF